MNYNLISYYNDRAKEYELIYTKPERQGDLILASQILQNVFKNKTVIEIACGTGYWTEKLSRCAKKIMATDINDAVLTIAKEKDYSSQNVTFQQVDVFTMAGIDKQESLFGGFIWSHIQLQDLPTFIATVNNLVDDNGLIAFIDNNFVIIFYKERSQIFGHS